MPNYCPFCAAPLSPTGDAYCGECRGQLDEAPPPGTTPADLEMRRRISGEGPGRSVARILALFVLLAFVSFAVQFVIRVFARR